MENSSIQGTTLTQHAQTNAYLSSDTSLYLMQSYFGSTISQSVPVAWCALAREVTTSARPPTCE